MTMQEASERYRIPLWVLRAYEGWGLRAGAPGQYSDADLQRLSLVMTLCDIGFSGEQARQYLLLLQEGEHTRRRRLAMLEARRGAVLDEIRSAEGRLQKLDYLRHQLRKKEGGR